MLKRNYYYGENHNRPPHKQFRQCSKKFVKKIGYTDILSNNDVTSWNSHIVIASIDLYI